MTHAQKPDFVFRRNGRVHLNRRGVSVQSTTGSRDVRISGSNAGYSMFRGSVKSTGYSLHSPVSPSLPLPCVTVCHQVSTGLYYSSSFAHLSANLLLTLNTPRGVLRGPQRVIFCDPAVTISTNLHLIFVCVPHQLKINIM